ncbi:MAG: hypothetical protein V3V50_01165 [Gammaproteobacteria bacterium]
MNESDARELLKSELEIFSRLPYAELTGYIHHASIIKNVESNGTHYQVEIKIVWNQRYRQDVCVIGAIHDGGWRALLPLLESYIVSPDGDVRNTKGV